MLACNLAEREDSKRKELEEKFEKKLAEKDEIIEELKKNNAMLQNKSEGTEADAGNTVVLRLSVVGRDGLFISFFIQG